jgi:hypothetical protein
VDRQHPAPYRFHEIGTANNPVRVEDQTGKERALAAGVEGDDLAVVTDDVDPAQDPKQHASSVTRFSCDDPWR